MPAPLQAASEAASSGAEAGERTRGDPGCAYAGRCAWQIGKICETEPPPWRETADGLRIRCHHRWKN